MTQSQLALSLIRPSLSAKLTDRAWFIPVLFAAFILLAAFLGRVDFTSALNAIIVLVGGPAAAEKLKDAYIGGSAVRSDVPQSVAVNTIGDATAGAPKPKPDGEKFLDALKSVATDSAKDYAGAQLDKATGVPGLGATLGVGAPDPLPAFEEVAR